MQRTGAAVEDDDSERVCGRVSITSGDEMLMAAAEHGVARVYGAIDESIAIRRKACARARHRLRLSAIVQERLDRQ